MGLREKIKNSPKLQALFQIDDTPKSIAMGAAVGMFIGMTPTVGIQMWMAFMASFVIKFNRIWAMAMVWISNPLTMIPMYYGMYQFGIFVLGMPDLYPYPKFVAIFTKITGQHTFYDMMSTFVDEMILMGMNAAGPMFFGGALLGLILSFPTYYIVFRMITNQRARKLATAEATSETSAEESTDTSDTDS